MNDYLSKPVNPHALAAMLKKWLADEKETTVKAREPRKTEGHAPDGREETVFPVFDKAVLMERLMDDKELAQAVIAGFLEDIPRQIESLRGYLDASDAPGAERQAHTIKGASANVGGEALREMAVGMEKAGKAGDLDIAKAGMPELEMQFERLKEAMERCF